MSTCTLTGPALRQEAQRLGISGRSRMTADQLRVAIGDLYRVQVIAEYRAACTEYATRPSIATGQRLRKADDAREASGIKASDIPPPDGCPAYLHPPKFLPPRTVPAIPVQDRAPFRPGPAGKRKTVRIHRRTRAI